MSPGWLTDGSSWLGVAPAFRIYARARPEKMWRQVRVLTNRRRDPGSGWPLLHGTCTTWSAELIAVGPDFARAVLREQRAEPASRGRPLGVAGGRLHDIFRRVAAGGPSVASASEILAHECGHTWQALRLGPLYLPFVGAVTWFREGPRPWNHFENQASELGLFGGLVNDSVHPDLLDALRR